ncbi:putative B3 domain-containing protein REM4 [Raphanus sativus]|uniref:B3 domain-containing protein REM4 n=1 Tax=Raphanus sativus TaxID=3726 RepID=A0A9W3D6S0_RAPSA|nr:putative B3 domain-containing protein REM4 [Raphanus sativus]
MKTILGPPWCPKRRVLSFRHDGDMVFHVTPFGRSFSHQILQFISSTSEDENEDDEHNIFDDDVFDEDDDEEHADAGDDDDDDDDEDEDGDSEEELCPNKTSSKKRAITETENSYLLAHVTSSTLSRNHLSCSKSQHPVRDTDTKMIDAQ